jgi:hypothetical protein
MSADRDVWLEGGIVWAAPSANPTEEANRDLTQRALALAAETENWRILFDFRRSKLTHDVLALNRQAELISEHGLPAIARTAMLCRHRSTDFQFWERVLNLRGLSAATFTDGEAAIGWLRVQEQPPAEAASAPEPVDLALMKSTRLTERVRLDFRADAFNIFNHADFDVPGNSTSLYSVTRSGNVIKAVTIRTPSSTLGMLTQTLGSPRVLQLSMHLVF